MVKTPLVSVILPAYNASRFIRQTLDSVLSQTYTNIEVIVVDDGSEDETAQVVQTVAKGDERVLLLQQRNQGVAAARNLAIAKSQGEYIAPIDADDLWHPQKIERQVESILRGGPHVGLVYTWWTSIDEEGLPIYSSPKWRMDGTVYRALIALNFIGNASVPLIRRHCIDHVGPYNAEWKDQGGQGCEDWDLSLRIAEHYQFRVIPDYLVGYRSVKGSMAWDFNAMKTSHELMIEDVMQRHPEMPGPVHRWSRSNLYLYLAGVSLKSGMHKAAASWVFKAFCSKETTLFSPWAARLVLISLRKTRPVRGPRSSAGVGMRGRGRNSRRV